MKRKYKRRHSQHTKARSSHIRSLGFENQKEYQDWCVLNGFADTIEKDEDACRDEFLASLSTGPGWRHFAEKQLRSTNLQKPSTGNVPEAFDRVLSGRVDCAASFDSQYACFCAGVERLRGQNFEKNLEAYRSLIYLLHHRGMGIDRFGRRMRRATAGSCTFAEALASVASHRQHWIRPLETWHCAETKKHRDLFHSLVLHLFVRHCIPDCLLSCWFHEKSSVAQDEIEVFIHLAHGHSIRTAGIGMPYSKRMSHYFQRAPHALCLNQAIWWGHVRGKGGDTELGKVFAGSAVGKDIEHAEFWGQVVDWFIANPDVAAESVGPIVDFLNNQRFGVGNPLEYADGPFGERIQRIMPASQPRLCMLGRTSAALMRDMERWHRDFQRLGSNDYAWQRSVIPSFQTRTKGGAVWSIKEMISSAELFKDSQMQNHCVASYAHSCAEGNTTIWSMTRTCDGVEKRCLTIQVNPNHREIVQVRGKNNRSASKVEMQVLESWAWESGLSIGWHL